MQENLIMDSSSYYQQAIAAFKRLKAIIHENTDLNNQVNETLVQNILKGEYPNGYNTEINILLTKMNAREVEAFFAYTSDENNYGNE